MHQLTLLTDYVESEAILFPLFRSRSQYFFIVARRLSLFISPQKRPFTKSPFLGLFFSEHHAFVVCQHIVCHNYSYDADKVEQLVLQSCWCGCV